MPIMPSADVSDSAFVAPTANIWNLAQVREGAEIGDRVTVGIGAYIGPGVHIGVDSRIQNYALVYEPAILGEGCFIGPAAVLTNDQFPRSVNPDGRPKAPTDWEAVGVTVGRGASVGARAVCIGPVRIGQWAMIAAGAVVTRDVTDFSLVAGVPARHVAWVGRVGRRLTQSDADRTVYFCPRTGETYRLLGQQMVIEAEAT